jgi:hypothetical protein
MSNASMPDELFEVVDDLIKGDEEVELDIDAIIEDDMIDQADEAPIEDSELPPEAR